MTLHSAAATLSLLKEGLPAAIKAADIDGQVEDKIFAGKFQMRLRTTFASCMLHSMLYLITLFAVHDCIKLEWCPSQMTAVLG